MHKQYNNNNNFIGNCMIALSYMLGHLFKFHKMCFGHKVRLKILFIEFHTKVTGRPAAGKSLERLSGRHFLRKIVATKTVCRLCIVCSKACRQAEGRKRPGRQISYECGQCNVALCIEPCFAIYHTKQDYVLAYKRLLGQPTER